MVEIKCGFFKTFINKYITLHFTWRIGNTSWVAVQRSAGERDERGKGHRSFEQRPKKCCRSAM